MRDTLRDFLYAVIVPAFVIYIAHFLFVTAYTGNWTVEAFLSQYTNGIYRYRILGRELVLVITEMISNTPLATLLPRVTDELEPIQASLYWAYYLLNTVCWIGTCIVWWWALGNRCDSDQERILVYLLLLLAGFIGMSVVVPYDMLSYLFLSATIVTVHKKSRLAVAAVVCFTVFGALTRETQALAITYAGVVLLVEGIDRQRVTMFLATFVPFTGTYLTLRILFGASNGVFYSVRLINNFSSPLRLLGLIGMIAFVGVASDVTTETTTGRRVQILTLILSTPYLLMIILFASFNEFRLIVPVLIVLVFATMRYEEAPDFAGMESLLSLIGAEQS